MRSYGKVYATFWTSEDIRVLTEDGRTLALYLMTCEHGNMLGCFRLTDAYAADDLKWSIERVSKGFADLVEKGYAYRCERTFWVVIYRHLKWNQFENPNVGKAAGKLFDMLGAPLDVKALLVKALREFSDTFPVRKLEEFETLSIPLPNPSVTSPETVALAVALALAVTVAPTVANPDVEQMPDDVQIVFEHWQTKMGHERAQLDDKRKKAIKARLKDGYSVDDLCMAIDGCKISPHHQGQNDSGTVYDDIELICRNGPNVDKFIARMKRTSASTSSLSKAGQATAANAQRLLEEDANAA